MTGNQGVLARNNVHVLGDGPTTIVFSHGFGLDQTCWAYQAEALSKKHRVILFDHVGCGKSDVSVYSPKKYDSLASFSMDLLEVLHEINANDTVYVGHSMGAMIGLLAALDQPKRFRRMAFLHGSPRYLDAPGYVGGFNQAALDGVFSAMATNYQGWVSGFAPAAMQNGERPELAAGFAATLGGMRPDIALAMARVIFQSDHRDSLKTLEHPTLVMQAQNDIAVPRDVGFYLAEQIPNAELLEVDAEGHFMQLSAHERVTGILETWLG